MKTKSKFLKRISALFVILAITVLSITSTTVFAATYKWPATSNIKTYVITTKNNTKVYKTATSADGSYGTIYASDLITINGYSGSRFKVTYPISKGTKTGYIEKSSVTSGTINSASDKWTASKKITTYRRSGGAEFGYVSKGDVCYSIATSENYTQIIYPISGGYKMGWIKTSDISSASTSESYSVSGNLLTVNGVSMTEYQLGSTYTSSRYANVNGKSVDMYGWQCCGYARYIQTKLYGCNDKSASAKFKNVAGTVSAGKLKATKLKSAVQAAGVGAHFRTQGNNHSMVIIDVTDSGFTVTDANFDGKNTIRVKSYTWSSYISSKYGSRGILYMKKYTG